MQVITNYLVENEIRLQLAGQKIGNGNKGKLLGRKQSIEHIQKRITKRTETIAKRTQLQHLSVG